MPGFARFFPAADETSSGVEKKFGLFFKRLYLCTPFTENRQNGLYERRVGQSVKTPPFHGGMRGSIPLRATRALIERLGFFRLVTAKSFSCSATCSITV